MNNSRRDFLKKSMIGLAGLSMSSLENVSFDRIDQVQLERNIVQRTLDRTGLKATIVGMGGANNSDLLPTAYDSRL